MGENKTKEKCSFCGCEVFCEHEATGAQKHSCFACFEKLIKNPGDEDLSKVHVEIPPEKMDEVMPRMLISSLINEAFPELWSKIEPELKDKSSREIAERMFSEGILTAFDTIITIGQESERHKKNMAK